MGNLVLTNRCNRECTYCFADKRGTGRDMALADAAAVMDLVMASGQPQIRLLGGEPTLHPHFSNILHAAMERGLETLIFSNGLMPTEALEAILRTPPEQCRVMLNLNVGSSDQAGEGSRISHVAEKLSGRACVGVNIHSPGMPLSQASDFVRAHGLARVIRVGLAQPRLDQRNRYLHPRHYRRVGEELEGFFDAIRPDGFSLSFDCGFVPCMFSPEFLELVGCSEKQMGCRCGPIPDVLPDLSAVHCLALSDLDQLPLSGIASLQEMRALLAARVHPFVGIGVFRECAGCGLRERGDCTGGCLSAATLRAQRRGLEVSRQPQAGPVTVAKDANRAASGKTWAIPYIDEGPAFWESLASQFGTAIREVYFPVMLPGVGTARPIQPHVHLPDLLRRRVLPMSVLVNPLVLPGPLEQVGPRIVDDVARLHEQYGVTAATVSDVRLAEMIRGRLPSIRLTASCLLDVTERGQAQVLRGLFDVLVPATRMIRRPDRLATIREAFGGPIRLIVNEGCLDSCLDRKQHFYEMGLSEGLPGSLCAGRLSREPWLRLTGAWVLPQHLDALEPLADEFKLAGRVTLADPEHYRRVLGAYIERRAIWPDDIGGGPASIMTRMSLPLSHFQWMLRCGHACGDCSVCARAWTGQWQSEAAT